MTLSVTDTVGADNCRRGFQAVYGSWAGTLIGQGRTDADVAAILESSACGLEGTGVEGIATRARNTVLRNLPRLREFCTP